MKNAFICITLFITALNVSFAQNDKRYWIGVNTSISTSALIRFEGEVDGGASYDGKAGFQLGIDCSKVINDKLNVETGLEYSRSTFYSSYIDANGQLVKNSNPEHIDLLTIPLNISVKLKNLFFITTGLQYDQTAYITNHSGIHNQTGIGINFKIGKEFRFFDNMRLSVAPAVVIHDLIPFVTKHNQQRLFNAGIRIGYRYRF
ncbi:hypothetical protein MASR1M74_10500 [Lentimicrobium sp.]